MIISPTFNCIEYLLLLVYLRHTTWCPSCHLL